MLTSIRALDAGRDTKNVKFSTKNGCGGCSLPLKGYRTVSLGLGPSEEVGWGSWRAFACTTLHFDPARAFGTSSS